MGRKNQHEIGHILRAFSANLPAEWKQCIFYVSGEPYIYTNIYIYIYVYIYIYICIHIYIYIIIGSVSISAHMYYFVVISIF